MPDQSDFWRRILRWCLQPNNHPKEWLVVMLSFLRDHSWIPNATMLTIKEVIKIKVSLFTENVLFEKIYSTFCCSIQRALFTVRGQQTSVLEYIGLCNHDYAYLSWEYAVASRYVQFLTMVQNCSSWTLSNTLLNCFEVFCWTTY